MGIFDTVSLILFPLGCNFELLVVYDTREKHETALVDSVVTVNHLIVAYYATAASSVE